MADLKKVKAPSTTETFDRKKIKAPTNNIYKAIKIMGKRAEEINLELKKELREKLAAFETDQEALAEVFENKEQIDISKFYERLPKSTAIALQEWLEDKIFWKELTEEEYNSQNQK